MTFTSFNPLHLSVDDLAPADLRSHEFDFTGFSCTQIASPQDARFERVYRALWDEFGPANEMESRAVIADRMTWRPEESSDGYAMLYAMTAVLYGDDLAAVRDHTAMVDIRNAGRPVVVHLSHVLIAEQFRGTGLSGWMRALPVRTARECMARAGVTGRRITLLAEMEPPVAGDTAKLRRLSAYEKVGFSKLDPNVVRYHQPDFRPPAVIDSAGGPVPVPLQLVLRRVGAEHEDHVGVDEVRDMLAAMRAMYARSFRAADLAALRGDIEHLPPGPAHVRLVRPTC